MNEETINWTADSMLEVTIKQPDDFLKIRETLTRIVLRVEKTRHYFKVVTYYTNKVNIS